MQIDNSFLDMNNDLPTDANRAYHLSATVEVKKMTLVSDGKPYEATRVYLVPVESMERTLFYNTFLPEYIEEIEEEDHTREIVFVCPRINRAFRAYLSRGDKHCQKIHIGLMTDSVKEYFLSMNNKMVQIESVPSDEEDKFDV